MKTFLSSYQCHILILIANLVCLSWSHTTSTLSSRFKEKPEFTNHTKEALRFFASLKKLDGLHICHVLPFSIIDQKLAQAFINEHGQLQGGSKIDKALINDLKTDIFKVDAESAFLTQADVHSKMGLFHENTNQRQDLEDEVSKLSLIADSTRKAYFSSVERLLSLFYNAPANLRISSEQCFNDDYNKQFIDPNLKSYSEAPRRTLKDAEFTEHSRYIAHKYRLLTISDLKGQIRTTDQRKSERNPGISGSLSEYNKGLNVFQFFMKSKTTRKHFMNETRNDIF